MFKNLPCNTRDTGLIPGPGRSHLLWNNKAHVPQPLTLCTATSKPVHLEPVFHNKEATTPQLQKAHKQQQRPAIAKKKKKVNKSKIKTVYKMLNKIDFLDSRKIY